MPRPLLLLTRPTDESVRSMAAIHEAGFDTLSAPLLHIEELPFAVPEGDFDRLLFTSPRAPEIVARTAPDLRRLLVLCVGPRTADMARQAGFQVEWTGDSDGNAVLRHAAGQNIRSVLQFCGRNRIELIVPEGISLTHVAVYDAVAATGFSVDAQQALNGSDLFAVLLFSPRTASIFVDIFDALGLDRQHVRLIALSDNVRKAAGPGWHSVAVAAQPILDSMLEQAQILRQQEQP